ncbi:hypothetical protein B0I35DRAFT_356707 [Stachybotrys elegans]|uniref:C2H2-type domain-containing protein n=1 Tax=Stachybotrys elegans TaxID=80388 RepID=A0A8K0WQ04_9HYPO|nr:hypothetical protein B0I35DRAFT_356707 [Stachybotrys elegans]
MAFATSYREQPAALPRIISNPGHPFGASHDHDSSSMSRSVAMKIPGSDSHSSYVPPPLPPPNYPLGNAPPRVQHRPHPSDMHTHKDRYSSFPSSSSHSDYGSIDDRPHYKARPFDTHDDGYSSMSAGSRDPLASKFPPMQTRHQFSAPLWQQPADIHGNSMKAKLNPMRGLDKPSLTQGLSLGQSPLGRSDSSPSSSSASRPYPPLALPFHSRPLDSARYPDTPVHSASALSPQVGGPFRHSQADHHPFSSDMSDPDHSPRHRRRNNSDDATSTQGSFEYGAAEDMDMDDTSSLKRRVEDAYSTTSQKRRAHSPEDHMMSDATSFSELTRRRDGPPRASPTPRLSTAPHGSALSMSISRSSSFMSTAPPPSMGVNTTIITAPSSYGRRSPGGFSPGGLSPTSCHSPYNTPISLNPSPRASISRAPVHSRNVSAASPRKINEVQRPGGSKFKDFFMCECCPKKPKKFETAEELSAHEAEKQYECSFCGNRFKNKNEAERHQNSLHVRRHSWSCSALMGFTTRAFHDSTTRPGEADTCGYCGDDFTRSGRGPGTGALSGGLAPRIATDQDWEERIRHLQEVHKFGECNSAKKFYRADHFRQHLKHSHAGTSGKWTNMLENACMLEEDPTPR